MSDIFLPAPDDAIATDSQPDMTLVYYYAAARIAADVGIHVSQGLQNLDVYYKHGHLPYWIPKNVLIFPRPVFR